MPSSENGRDEEDRPWWERGEEPDPRTTLANERTFLAWSRTAFGLLAASLGVIQLIKVAPIGLRLTVGCYLIAVGAGTAVLGYRRWRRRQEQLRAGQPFDQTRVPLLVFLALLVLAGLIAAVAAVAP